MSSSAPISSSPKTYFIHGKVILRDRVAENLTVVVQDGRIVELVDGTPTIEKSEQTIDLAGEYLSPGFIDIHVHGGLGADFMDGTTEAIELASHAHLRHGVTTIFPTTTTASVEQIQNVIRCVQEVQRQPSGKMPIPHIEGIHLYGPFFAEEKSGCHRKDACRSPSREEYQTYFDTGAIRIATCAAELDGAAEFYRLATERRCLVTCGHSNASWTEMEKAFENGMRHVDHFWCAMSTVQSVRTRFGTPMQGSMLEFVLGTPEMSTEVIADGCHLSPELLRFAWKMKTSSRLCLVSDSMRAVDMPPGKYLFGDAQDGGWILSDGSAGRTFDGGLASSVMALDTMVRTVVHGASIPLHEAVRMASLTPAERTGIDAAKGEIAVGKEADLLVFSNQIEIKQVYRGGVLTLSN